MANMTLHVDPTGTVPGSYLDLATAAAELTDNIGEEHRLVVYSGGDVGPMQPAFSNIAKLEIVAADGHRVGIPKSDGTGVARVSSADGGTFLTIAPGIPSTATFRVDGMLVNPTGLAVGPTVSVGLPDVIIENCQIAIDFDNEAAIGASLGVGAGVLNGNEVTIRRNSFYMNTPHGGVYYLYTQGSGSSPVTVGTLNFEHNTVVGVAEFGRRVTLEALSGGAYELILEGTCKNNAVTGTDEAFSFTGNGVGTETDNTVYAANASEDDTADDFGGTGHLTLIDPDECFAAPATDVRLVAGSPLIDAGVAIAGVNDDYLGDAPDIGVDEYRPPAAATTSRASTSVGLSL